jgi:hypothetical protein
MMSVDSPRLAQQKTEAQYRSLVADSFANPWHILLLLMHGIGDLVEACDPLTGEWINARVVFVDQSNAYVRVKKEASGEELELGSMQVRPVRVESLPCQTKQESQGALYQTGQGSRSAWYQIGQNVSLLAPGDVLVSGVVTMTHANTDFVVVECGEEVVVPSSALQHCSGEISKELHTFSPRCYPRVLPNFHGFVYTLFGPVVRALNGLRMQRGVIRCGRRDIGGIFLVEPSFSWHLTQPMFKYTGASMTAKQFKEKYPSGVAEHSMLIGGRYYDASNTSRYPCGLLNSSKKNKYSCVLRKGAYVYLRDVYRQVHPGKPLMLTISYGPSFSFSCKEDLLPELSYYI